jgi:L-fuconolactonase
MIIDAHQHFWEYDPVRYAWIDDSMQAIRKDFMPEDLKPIFDEQNIDGCVAVQADQSEEETLFLLNLAEQHLFVKAVVGWVDLRATNIEERLDHFSGYKNLAGFRHIQQAEEPDKMLEPNFLRGIGALQNHGFTYDILIYPRHLDAALELVRQFPEQKFVVDHMAKPNIKEGEFDSWAQKFGDLAGMDNVWCKVSGLITEADRDTWSPEELRPYLDFTFEKFGTKRLLYGSDWPVCLLAGSYKQVYELIEDYLAAFSDDEKRDVLGKNALGFYGIDTAV